MAKATDLPETATELRALDIMPSKPNCALAKRHRFWLNKKPGKGLQKSWRPKTQHRCSAKKWLRCVDNQLRAGTATTGLAWFKYDAENPQWLDARWDRWPYLMMCIDLGSDGLCGYMSAERHFKLNADLCPDWSHGGNRDVMLGLGQSGLKGMFQVLVMMFNLPHGPCNDDGWQAVIHDTVQHIKDHHGPSTPLFQAGSRRMLQAMSAQGIELPGEQDADQELWDFCMSQGLSRRSGQRVTMCRFQAGTAAAKHNLGYWEVDKFLRTAKKSMYASMCVCVGLLFWCCCCCCCCC